MPFLRRGKNCSVVECYKPGKTGTNKERRPKLCEHNESIWTELISTSTFTLQGSLRKIGLHHRNNSMSYSASTLDKYPIPNFPSNPSWGKPNYVTKWRTGKLFTSTFKEKWPVDTHYGYLVLRSYHNRVRNLNEWQKK